ncbi:hypothetical protein P5673_010463 [Acropora cervicornis]|uniref:Uncharacterized protein n=1 Tax=Acropora cervicornis TaxID=6130 RepID=A0AAD9QQD8_ACRCE|nr:hypothetical protein P5673_010463 [Acropora cervicornis]
MDVIGVSEVFTMEMSLLLFFHQTHGEQPCLSCSIFCSSKIWGNVLLSFEDFILKNDEVLRTFPASHFSEQR